MRIRSGVRQALRSTRSLKVIIPAIAASVLAGVVIAPSPALAADRLVMVGRTLHAFQYADQVTQSADGSLVAAIDKTAVYLIDPLATVPDLWDRAPIAKIEYSPASGTSGQPEALAVAPNGGAVYVYTVLDAKLRVISTATKTEVARITLTGAQTYGMAVSADNTKLYVARWGAARVEVYNLDPSDLTVAPVLVTSLTGIKRPGMPTVGPDGKVYVPVSGDGTDAAFDNKIAVIDPSNSYSVSYISGVGTGSGYLKGPRGIVFSPTDSSTAYIYNADGASTSSISTIHIPDNTVTNNVFELATSIPTSGGTQLSKSVTISQDGERLYVAASDGIRVLNVSAESNTLSYFGGAWPHVGTPYDVASLSSNGQLYAVGGWAQIDAIYVYEDMAPAPTVTAVSDSSGSTAGGTSITITGTGFVAGATVSIGGSPCSDVVVVSSTEITCTTPASWSGARDVSVTNPDAQVGTLSNGYTYVTPPAPTITKVSPSSGSVKGGTEITITGTNFDSEATVTVGGMPCQDVVVASSTKITCTTPPSLMPGQRDVVVTNPDNQSDSLTGGFTYGSGGGGGGSDTPSQPLDVVAAAGEGVVEVSWLPPASPGRSKVTGYRVSTSDNGGGSCSTGAKGRSCVIDGLSDGSYDFKVKALNEAGAGTPATVTGVTLPGKLGQVRNLKFTMRSAKGKARLVWRQPFFDGGKDIVAYGVKVRVAGTKEWTVLNDVSKRRVVLKGLTPSESYDVRVVPVTRDGKVGPETIATGLIPKLPGAPRDVVAVPSDGKVTVSWTSPAASGTSAVKSYKVWSSVGRFACTAKADERSCVVSGLKNGTRYSFTVRARNSSGFGKPGISKRVIPGKVPGVVSNIRVRVSDAGRATLVWTKPVSNGGRPVVSYDVSYAAVGSAAVSVTVTKTRAVISGLVKGTSYTFTVAARNAYGLGGEQTLTS